MFQPSQVNSINNIKGLISQNKLLESIKIELKKFEPPRPELALTYTNEFDNIRLQFNNKYYKFANWLCGCSKRNALFCYICLLANLAKGDINEEINPWVGEGVTNLKDLKIVVKEHQQSFVHMSSSLTYISIGNKDLTVRLSREHLLNVTQRNKQVQQNRYILSKLIDCVRYNTNYETEMKNILNEYSYRTGPIFTELLVSIYEVCCNLIKKEINKTDFLAVEVYEATAMATSPKLIFVVRYELRGEIYERFIGFLTPTNKHATGISEAILSTLIRLGVNKTPDKLICYSYDGFLTVHTKNWGMQLTIVAAYPKARFVHSYAHNLEMIIEHFAVHFKEIKIFFAQLESCASFFSHTGSASKLLSSDCVFDTKPQAVNTLSMYANAIKACVDYVIVVESEPSIVTEAVTVKNLLTDYDFNYWLDFFWKLLPHCDCLFAHLEILEISSVFTVQKLVDAFKEHIKHIRAKIERKYSNMYPFATVFLQDDSHIEENSSTNHIKQEPLCGNRPVYPQKERMNDEIAKKICALIVEYVEERFCQMPGLALANLVPICKLGVPVMELQIAADVFKLDKQAIKIESGILSEREEFKDVAGALALLQYFYENDLRDAFPETFKLLKMCCTIPITTSEPGRCFSTLTKSRDFFKLAHREENLDVLAMCSLEKDLMKRTAGFCNLVINRFCTKYKKQTEFEYKPVC